MFEAKKKSNSRSRRYIYTFLHDFNLIYEIGRVATAPNYDFSFSDLIYSREEGLKIHMRDEDRLHVETMSKKSPLELSTLVVAVPAAVGAIWGLIQIVEKVVNFRVSKEAQRRSEKVGERNAQRDPLSAINEQK